MLAVIENDLVLSRSSGLHVAQVLMQIHILLVGLDKVKLATMSLPIDVLLQQIMLEDAICGVEISHRCRPLPRLDDMVMQTSVI